MAILKFTKSVADLWLNLQNRRDSVNNISRWLDFHIVSLQLPFLGGNQNLHGNTEFKISKRVRMEETFT